VLSLLLGSFLKVNGMRDANKVVTELSPNLRLTQRQDVLFQGHLVHDFAGPSHWVLAKLPCKISGEITTVIDSSIDNCLSFIDRQVCKIPFDGPPFRVVLPTIICKLFILL